MKKLILIVIFILINCSNQKEICYERLRQKDLFSGESRSLCIMSLFYMKRESELVSQGRSADSETLFANIYLLQCLNRFNEEQECEKESEYIPHLGY